ncbi:MAG: peptidase M61 [Ideonella sp. MAG2]|nr:MAG: peptidase M61 [Ideonella sp. MAG2]
MTPRLAHKATTGTPAAMAASNLLRPLCLALLCAWAAQAHAQAAAPHTADTAGVATLPAPRDETWPGTIQLHVDSTELDQRIQRVRQTLPVDKAGRLTLLYPRWLPGTHGPYNDIGGLTGLMIHAGTQRLAWVRDVTDPYAFHVEVPAGVKALNLQFEYLAPLSPAQGRVNMSRSILGVQWNQLLLYPAGHFASGIKVQARLKLPEGWQQASALRDAKGQVPQPGPDGWVEFAPVSLETLVDSPLFAGKHAKRIELDPPQTDKPVALNLLADEASHLEASPAQLDAHRALVQQSDKLFGARHWRHYDFLLSLSDNFGGIGLEHHESSENGVHTDYFKDWDKSVRARELLPHEYVHSWNGKFRRPLDLWTPQYNVPMRNSLLWVYEGMTQYWGHVLAARSGLTTPAQARDRLAQVAATLNARVGRTWRNLQDTTNEGTMASRRDKAWRDWQRGGGDYYDEATLIWLDADSLIREKSGDTKSLDDFARAFFGIATTRHADGSIKPATYTFDDVVRTLNGVQPHDWAKFLRERLDTNNPGAPLDGLARSGWKLSFAEQENEFAKHDESSRGRKERTARYPFSLGLSLADDGELVQVVWGSPAFAAKLAPGMVLAAVNMEAYSPERLSAAITANKSGKAPIQLLLRQGERYRQVTLDYRDGLRYPVLERVGNGKDRLSAIQAAR